MKWMIVFVFIFLPATVYRIMQVADDFMMDNHIGKTLILSDRARKLLFLRKNNKGNKGISVYGFVFYIIVAYPMLIFTVAEVLISIICIIKFISNINFAWIPIIIVSFSSMCALGYSVVMFLIFSLIAKITGRYVP
jgi:hypothetical protein